MASTLHGNPFFQKLEAEHRCWLSSFDPQYLAKWEGMLNGDEEAALAEARVRALLQGYGIGVEPNDVRGVLHPNPVRPFHPAILPEVEFGRVDIDRASGQLRVVWAETDHE